MPEEANQVLLHWALATQLETQILPNLLKAQCMCHRFVCVSMPAAA